LSPLDVIVWLGELPFFTNLVNQLDTIPSWFFLAEKEVLRMTNNIKSSTISGHDEIQAARRQINQLDQSIIDLLKKRFETSARIGRIKEESQLPVLDNDREKQVLEQVAQHDSDAETQKYLQNIFQAILKNSRDYQHQLMQKESK
jgi:chorismate mutase